MFDKNLLEEKGFWSLEAAAAWEKRCLGTF